MNFFFQKLLVGCNTNIIRNPAQVGNSVQEEYDYIIVGGGTAGCVLASRLTEDPSVKVLLFESGVSGRSLILSRIPVGFPLLFRGKHVYNFYTEPQPEAQGKKKYWPRGKMLGGCSSVNAQMAQYGAPGDFDQWAEIINDDAWSWKNFSRYFRKFEKYVEDPDYPDVDCKTKGDSGPVRVGYFSTISDGSKDFIQSCKKLGIQYNPDFTSNGTRGVNRIMTYIDETRIRVSSESAYLTDDVLTRSNLKVVINATVTKVITESVNNEIKATGVEFCQTRNGPRFTACSKREVIVSAGAVHTPQILMLSGIGPAELLGEMRIPVVDNLSGVGSNLIDHPVVDVYFKNRFKTTNFMKPKWYNLWDLAKLVGSIFQYLTSQRGALVTNFGESAAFCRTDDTTLFSENEYPDKLDDSTSGADSPDLEIFTTPYAYKGHGAYIFPMHTFSIHACLLRPMSRGTIRLKSTNPFDHPLIDPNYLGVAADVEKLKRAVKLVLKISKQEPLSYRLDLEDNSPLLDSKMDQKTDAELENIVRERVETLYHPTSTCRMAPLDSGGVVDSQLRVYGVKGLRVCDASIFPEIVSGHTTGAVLASAEYLADAIKSEGK